MTFPRSQEKEHKKRQMEVIFWLFDWPLGLHTDKGKCSHRTKLWAILWSIMKSCCFLSQLPKGKYKLTIWLHVRLSFKSCWMSNSTESKWSPGCCLPQQSNLSVRDNSRQDSFLHSITRRKTQSCLSCSVSHPISLSLQCLVCYTDVFHSSHHPSYWFLDIQNRGNYFQF